MGDIETARDVLEHVLQSVKHNYLSTESYKREFDELKVLSDEFSVLNSRDDGWLQFNRNKNRYKDILPYDKTRVRLPIVNNIPGSDYINASHISGPEGFVNYIAAQGPLPHTIFDFWRMIWYNYVTVIVMVCKQIELGKEKCGNYWGKSVGEVQKWGNFSVSLVSEQHDDHHVVRTLQLQCAEVTREVYQYQFLDWPDRDVPTDSEPLYKMLTLVRERSPERTSSNIPDSPIVIHCSAGCGRTGTVLAIDFIGTLIKQSRLTKEFSVFELVKQMRGERVAICQTKQQYGFVYYTVIQLLDNALQALEQRSEASTGDSSIYENVPVNNVSSKETPLPPKPLISQFEKPPRPSKPPKPEKPKPERPKTPISTGETGPTPTPAVVVSTSEPVYAQINQFTRTGKLIDLGDGDKNDDDTPPPLPASPILDSDSDEETMMGNAESAAAKKTALMKIQPTPANKSPGPKRSPLAEAPRNSCQPVRPPVPTQLPTEPPARPSKVPSPYAKRAAAAVTAAAESRSSDSEKKPHPPSRPPLNAPKTGYAEVLTHSESGKEEQHNAYAKLNRGEQVQVTVSEAPPPSGVKNGGVKSEQPSVAAEEPMYSELFMPHSDSADSHLHLSSGDEDGEEEDHYETIESIEKDGKSKEKSSSLSTQGKKFGLRGKKLKSKTFAFKGLLANISDSAHEASNNFKNKSHLTSNITRTLTSGSSPTPSHYNDLPDLVYVSEFGVRTGKPIGPREMPDHWIKI